MTAHPRVILRQQGRVPKDGARLESQGTRTRTCRLHQVPRQPALGKESVRAHDERQWETSLMSKRTWRITAKGARRVGRELQRRHPTGTLEASRDHGGVYVDFRRLTKTFRRIQHVTHVTKPNVGGFNWSKAKDRAASRSCHRVIPRSAKAATGRGGVCNMLMSSSVFATYRNALLKSPTNPSQTHDHRTQRTMNSMPRWIRTVTINPSPVRTN